MLLRKWKIDPSSVGRATIPPSFLHSLCRIWTDYSTLFKSFDAISLQIELNWKSTSRLRIKIILDKRRVGHEQEHELSFESSQNSLMNRAKDIKSLLEKRGWPVTSCNWEKGCFSPCVQKSSREREWKLERTSVVSFNCLSFFHFHPLYVGEANKIIIILLFPSVRHSFQILLIYPYKFNF